MKKYILLFISICTYINGLTQESLIFASIDSVINENEKKVSTSYQKIERNRIESTHGKNSSHILTLFKICDDNMLLSVTQIAYSINDTSLIINSYFNNGQLQKVTQIDFNDFDNHKSENNYYFRFNQLINKSAETLGPYSSNHFIEQAKRILLGLKKRPIKFPSLSLTT